MTLADKLIALNSALATIDNLLLDCDNEVEVRMYYSLQERVDSVYTALSEEWLETADNPI